MIEAIIPIPNRYPLNMLIGTGFGSVYCNEKTINPIGRTCVVLPINFYKVFSRDGLASYQHIFASDSIIDPVYLLNSRNIFTGLPSKNGGTFVPISVKRLHEHGCVTFLFAKCIDFLIRTYKLGVPFDEANAIDSVTPSLLCPNCYGVSSVADVNFQYLRQEAERTSFFGIPPRNRIMMSALTPELPHVIGEYIDELMTTQCYGIDLIEYFNDWARYESGTNADMKEMLQRTLYNFPLDPVTMACVNSPSYIYGAELLHYLGDPDFLRTNARLGYHMNELDPAYVGLNVNFETADPYSFSDDLMEEIMLIGDDCFRVTIMPGDFRIDPYSIIPTDLSPAGYNNLIRMARTCFQEWPYIEIIKTWQDEVFINLSRTPEPGPVRYYMNLAWYHIMSPSLINRKGIG